LSLARPRFVHSLSLMVEFAGWCASASRLIIWGILLEVIQVNSVGLVWKASEGRPMVPGPWAAQLCLYNHHSHRAINLKR
jgi:hypothetical protein